jgi:hypothetical protein
LRATPETGLDVAELAVAVRGLVEVHEVHVDLRPGQLDIGLGVQVQQRLAERVEPGDPHLGGGEGVHPGDDAHAGVARCRLQACSPDGVTGGEDRLPDQPDVELVRERLADLLRLLGHLLQRLVTVEGLAAGEEPDLEVVVVLGLGHEEPFLYVDGERHSAAAALHGARSRAGGSTYPFALVSHRA